MATKPVVLDTLPEVQLLSNITRESASRVIEQLSAYKGRPVALSIFSDGGDAMGSLAVAQYIADAANHMQVEARIYGNAASGAMIIAAAAQKAYISEGAFALVHFAYAAGVDDADLSEQDKALLASINDTQVELFAKRTGKKPGEVKKLMQENKNITAEDALAFGLFDGLIAQEAKIAAFANTQKMSEKKTITVKVGAADAMKAIASGTIEVPKEAVEAANTAELDALKKQVEDLIKERDELKTAKDAAETAKTNAEKEKDAEVTAKATLESDLKAARETVGKFQAAIEELKKTPLKAQTLPDGTQVVIPGGEAEKKEPISAEGERVKRGMDTYNAYFQSKEKVTA